MPDHQLPGPGPDLRDEFLCRGHPTLMQALPNRDRVPATPQTHQPHQRLGKPFPPQLTSPGAFKQLASARIKLPEGQLIAEVRPSDLPVKGNQE